ncbi:MAG: hypothetical protein SGPRY_010563 [Prymnesium sp.]
MQFCTLLAYTAMGLWCFVRARRVDEECRDQTMLLLLLCCNICFGEMVARMLMLRLARLDLPYLSLGVACLCGFRIALEVKNCLFSALGWLSPLRDMCHGCGQ